MEEVFRDYGVFENANNNRIVCVNITQSYLLHQRPNLYECTRKWWRLNGERAQNADFVFAICSGYSVGVFKPTRWFKTENVKNAGRWEFEGEEVPDSPFINQSVAHLMHRRQNPVMYINM